MAPSPGYPGSHQSFLGPTRVHNPNDISIGSSVFVGLTVVFNRQRQTDRATSAYINKTHLCTLCMRCGLIIILFLLCAIDS